MGIVFPRTSLEMRCWRCATRYILYNARSTVFIPHSLLSFRETRNSLHKLQHFEQVHYSVPGYLFLRDLQLITTYVNAMSRNFIPTHTSRFKRCWRAGNCLCGRVKRRRSIFPWGYPPSIIRAEELNFRVRDGNGCTFFAIVTGSPAHTGSTFESAYLILFLTYHSHLLKQCEYFIYSALGTV